MKHKQRHILIIRLSALGDVAIAAPLVKAYAAANPEIRFSFVSQPALEPLFSGVPNLVFVPFRLQHGKSDFFTLIRFARYLKTLRPTEVADIHDVHRSQILRWYLRWCGIPNRVIDKNRKNKKALVRPRNKIKKQLTTSQQAYENVLTALGLENLHFSSRPVRYGTVSSPAAQPEIRQIGIAPFAKHKGKCWPVESMIRVIERLSSRPENRIILFGGGTAEAETLRQWERYFPRTVSAAGKYTLKEELELIRELDVMVCMDSANMHFASAVHTPVVSIWGATHPYAGFYGWGQPPENAVQTDLPCRPCSVFGNKECYRGDYACLSSITPERVLQKIEAVLETASERKRRTPPPPDPAK